MECLLCDRVSSSSEDKGAALTTETFLNCHGDPATFNFLLKFLFRRTPAQCDEIRAQLESQTGDDGGLYLCRHCLPRVKEGTRAFTTMGQINQQLTSFRNSVVTKLKRRGVVNGKKDKNKKAPQILKAASVLEYLTADFGNNATAADPVGNALVRGKKFLPLETVQVSRHAAAVAKKEEVPSDWTYIVPKVEEEEGMEEQPDHDPLEFCDSLLDEEIRDERIRCTFPECHTFFPDEVLRDAHCRKEHLGIDACFICPTCDKGFVKIHNFTVHRQKCKVLPKDGNGRSRVGISRKESQQQRPFHKKNGLDEGNIVKPTNSDNNKSCDSDLLTSSNIPTLATSITSGNTPFELEDGITPHNESGNVAVDDDSVSQHYWDEFDDDGAFSSECTSSGSQTQSDGSAWGPLKTKTRKAGLTKRTSIKEIKAKKVEPQSKKQNRVNNEELVSLSTKNNKYKSDERMENEGVKSHHRRVSRRPTSILPKTIYFTTNDKDKDSPLEGTEETVEEIKIRRDAEGDSDTAYSDDDDSSSEDSNSSAATEEEIEPDGDDDASDNEPSVSNPKKKRKTQELQFERPKRIKSSEGLKYALYPVYGCALCKTGFNSVNDLHRHFEIHPKELESGDPLFNNNYYCHACNTEKFPTIEALEGHIVELHKCKECSSIMKNANSMHTHVLYMHRRHLQRTCDYCEKRFSRGDEHLLHSLAEHYREYGVEPLKCRICDDKFTFQTQLLWRKHMEEKHNKKPEGRKCSIGNCRQVSYHPTIVTLHFKIIHEKRFKCSLCGKEFLKESNWTQHKNLCGGPDGGKLSRVQHDRRLRLARGLTHYTCETCGKQFCSQSSYYYHKYSKHIPEGMENKFQCNFCGLQFPIQGALGIHMKRKHSKTKRPTTEAGPNHQCHFCGSKYTSKGTLWLHLKTRHDYHPRPGDPPQPVPQEVADAAVLFKTKECNPNYFCHFSGCEAKYVRYISLRRHWKERHEFLPQRGFLPSS